MKKQVKSSINSVRTFFHNKSLQASVAVASAMSVATNAMAQGALPAAGAPSRGEGDTIVQTAQNHGFDLIMIAALVLCSIMFLGVAYHSYGAYAGVQNGKKTWGDFGGSVLVGAVLLVVVIWLFTEATGIL